MLIPATTASKSSKAVKHHTHHLISALLLHLSLKFPLVWLPTAGLNIIIIIHSLVFTSTSQSQSELSNIVHKSWTILHKAGNYYPPTGSLSLFVTQAVNIAFVPSMLDENNGSPTMSNPFHWKLNIFPVYLRRLSSADRQAWSPEHHKKGIDMMKQEFDSRIY